MRIALVFLAAALVAPAQDIKMPPSIEKLAAVADKHSEVTLDSNMLQFAGKFLSDKDADQSKAKRIVAGLKGITVRSYEFSGPGQYSMADLDPLREELKAPGWSHVVSASTKRGGESSDVYFKASEGSQIGGIVVICAEPRELSIVSLTGAISVDDLSSLGGQFGIPKVDVPAPRKEEEE